MTDAERKLWYYLRGRRLTGLKFKRQYPVGRYIADFACVEHHLIIEVDGGQHVLSARRDAERTKELEAMGFLVRRFWNNDVLANIEGVLGEVLGAIQRAPEPPHAGSLPLVERENKKGSAR